MAFLKRNESSLVKKPTGQTSSETIAEAVAGDGRDERAGQTNQAMGRYPCEAKKPAVNRSESPGKKNPKNRPVSAKTAPMTPSVPKAEIEEFGVEE